MTPTREFDSVGAMPAMAAAAATWLELALLCVGGAAFFLRRGYTAAEAAACALVGVPVLLSLLLRA